MIKYFLLLLILYNNFLFSQTVSSMKDPRDGLTYKIVDIGGKTWFAENLNTSKFNNGETIFQAKNLTEWTNAMNSNVVLPKIRTAF
jgi:hypothetical protein